MIFAVQITILILMLIVNCLVHSSLNKSRLKDYLKKTTVNDWLVNFKTIAIWGFGSGLVFHLSRLNLTFIKFQNSFSIYEHILSFVIIFFIHGVYIYYSHRSLHSIKKIKKYHGLHHRPRMSGPLSAWIIHPVEACIDTIGIILLGLLIPGSYESFFVYTFFAFQINMWAHFTLGNKANSLAKKIIYLLGNYHHHTIHHNDPNKNFGAFVLLDYILGTHSNKYPNS